MCKIGDGDGASRVGASKGSEKQNKAKTSCSEKRETKRELIFLLRLTLNAKRHVVHEISSEMVSSSS